MENGLKLQIYKGIIQYLLESTNFSLNNIASLINSSLKNIRSIYCHNHVPLDFNSELKLLELYQFIVELHTTSDYDNECL